MGMEEELERPSHRIPGEDHAVIDENAQADVELSAEQAVHDILVSGRPIGHAHR